MKKLALTNRSHPKKAKCPKNPKKPKIQKRIKKGHKKQLNKLLVQTNSDIKIRERLKKDFNRTLIYKI